MIKVFACWGSVHARLLMSGNMNGTDLLVSGSASGHEHHVKRREPDDGHAQQPDYTHDHHAGVGVKEMWSYQWVVLTFEMQFLDL